MEYIMAKFRKIGILTSGGDAPGMNAAIRAIARKALSEGIEVVGIYEGYSGLINGNVKPLTSRSVSNIITTGGTMLYSSRCPEFKTEKGIMKAVETCREYGIDGIVAIGGDGTFRGATDLTMHGVPCIGIPGTIDNDISSTDYTIGFDTAMNTVVDMVDRLRDTCESHARCNVVEVMGRGAGDIALSAGIASGATAAIIPEIEADIDELCKKISASRRKGKRNFIVLVSEGMGADYAPKLAETIKQQTGVDTKFARLAHVVRGGSPSLRDRVVATQMGYHAVEKLLEGQSNRVICYRDGEIHSTDINYALKLDHFYKGKITEEELRLEFSPERIEKMKEQAQRRRKMLVDLYEIGKQTSL